jgi:hypothetical protein
MLDVSSNAVVVVHYGGSSAAVVAASECWVSAPEDVAIAFGIGGATFALASVAGSSVVA